MEPEFSIIVPTFGRPEFLAQALDSVVRQSVPDFECLVVDDGSPVPVSVPEDPRIRLIRRDDNGGPAAARNTGLASATGRYILFIDDDDRYTPDRLEIARAGLRTSSLALCWSRYLDSPARRQRRLEGMVYDEILNRTTPHLGTVALSREVTPFFNEQYLACEDLEWWLRASKGLLTTTIPRVGYLVRRHHEVRVLTGNDARVRFSRRLLEDYPDYFSTHRRAEAFRWKRIGLLALKDGGRRQAREAFLRAFRVLPTPSVARHLIRTLMPR